MSDDPQGPDPSPAFAVWKVSFVAIFGAFLTQLDGVIVNVSLTTMAQELESDLPTIQWVTSGYLLALALALPLTGWLVDRFGVRFVYLGSFMAFTVTSMLCGLAWSAPSLIAFRVLQGMSGGLLTPMAQMMLARVAGNRLPHVMGYAAMPVLLAPMLGPVIAGYILQHASWPILFYVNVPFGALAIVTAAIVLPLDDRKLSRTRFDYFGFALLSPGLALFLYGIDALASPEGAGALLLSLVMLGAFILVARRKGRESLINLDLFRAKSFATSVKIQFLANGTSFAGQMLLPIYLIRACGQSPAAAGVMLAPIGLGMACFFPFLGRLTDRFGIRHVSATGALISALATVPVIAMAYTGFNSRVFVIALFCRGAGMSMIGVPSVSCAYSAVDREDVPMASTTLNVVQRLGGPALTTICASFLGWRLGASPQAITSHAFGQALMLLGSMQLILWAIAMRLPLRLPPNREESGDKALPATLENVG